MWPAACCIVFNCLGLYRTLKDNFKNTLHILLHVYRATNNYSYSRLLNIRSDIFHLQMRLRNLLSMMNSNKALIPKFVIQLLVFRVKFDHGY